MNQPNQSSRAKVESVCESFAEACRSGAQPEIEEYLVQGPPGSQGDLLVRLVEIDLWWRRAEPPVPDAETYKKRFPGFADRIDQAIESFKQSASSEEDASHEERTQAALVDTAIENRELSTMLPDAEAWPSQGVSPGPQRIGRYTVVQQLGRGGQGAVYRALHPNLPIELAIKVSVKALDPAHQKALRDEAQILCDLDHPNIARVRDLDFHHGKPFLVLDFIRGRSLRERLGKGGISTEQEVGWLAKVARAIDFAHRRGTLHLDLKPDNIVIDDRDEPKVIDFGLARVRDVWNVSDAEQDRVSGTLQYMAPEQAEGKASMIGAHSDIFSLGAILYRILVGNPPYHGRDVPKLLQQVRRGEFDRAALDSVDARPELKAACVKAMSMNTADRFASAAEFANAIGLPPNRSAKSTSVTLRIFAMSLTLTITAAVLLVILRYQPGAVETMASIEHVASKQSAERTQNVPSGSPPAPSADPEIMPDPSLRQELSQTDGKPDQPSPTTESLDRELARSPAAPASMPSDTVQKPKVRPDVGSESMPAKTDAIAEQDTPVLSPASLEGFVWIEPGSFQMGSPLDEKGRQPDETRHEVTLTSGYYLGKFEITQKQYNLVMGNQGRPSQRSNIPAVGVGWSDAMNFCHRLNESDQLPDKLGLGEPPDGYRFALPSEAQWEYACRAGNPNRLSPAQLASVAVCYVPGGRDFQTPQPTGSKKPNAWGLYDMLGNVEEWCRDGYAPYPKGAVSDPVRDSSAENHVIRGGFYMSSNLGNVHRCRAAHRDSHNGFSQYRGFRVALIRASLNNE